ncbi:MAG: hypothetical protein Q8O52_05815 [Sulfuritalea sp.]|nr:hypothetical protein [Sulfuritalea sp.]
METPQFVVPAVSTHPGFRFAAGEAGTQNGSELDVCFRRLDDMHDHEWRLSP